MIFQIAIGIVLGAILLALLPLAIGIGIVAIPIVLILGALYFLATSKGLWLGIGICLIFGVAPLVGSLMLFERNKALGKLYTWIWILGTFVVGINEQIISKEAPIAFLFWALFCILGIIFGKPLPNPQKKEEPTKEAHDTSKN